MAYTATKTFRDCSESRVNDRRPIRARHAARFSGAILTRLMVGYYFMRRPSAQMRASQISLSNRFIGCRRSGEGIPEGCSHLSRWCKPPGAEYKIRSDPAGAKDSDITLIK